MAKHNGLFARPKHWRVLGTSLCPGPEPGGQINKKLPLLKRRGRF